MATPNDPNRDALIRQQAERDAAASRASLIGTSLAGPRAEVNGPRAQRLQQPSTTPRPTASTTAATPASTPAPTPPTPAPAPRAPAPTAPADSGSYVERGGRRLTPAELDVYTERGNTRGIDLGASALAAQQRAAQPVDRMARRSVVDEFNATREGVMMPRAFDPTSARLTGRSDAFNITNPRSRERELVDLAMRVANDSSLKGFAGARNAIIGQIMGQLDAGNAASLEAQQQAGRAGLGLQGFDQDAAMQEFDRRGARLRDQFLEEGQMRLARLNNDADMAQVERSGQFQLDAARARGEGSGRSSNSDELKRSDAALEAARAANPDDVMQANVDAIGAIVDSGIDYRGLPAGNTALQGVRNAVRGQYNDDSWLAELDAALTPGVSGNDARLGYDFNVQDLEVPEDQPWAIDLVQFVSPESVQPYVVRQRGKPGTEQIIKPALGAPSESQLRRLQELDSANWARGYSAASARDPRFVRNEREAD